MKIGGKTKNSENSLIPANTFSQVMQTIQ